MTGASPTVSPGVPGANGQPLRRALGVMSGTSLDGIDVALVETDGAATVIPGPALTAPYDAETRAVLAAACGAGAVMDPATPASQAVTAAAAAAIETLLQRHHIDPVMIDVIGFHGQTLYHAPHRGQTVQAGDGAALAARTGIQVVDDFRRADMAAGGEGAPLAPVYHRALARDLAGPLAIVNIGGVANITWLGDDRRGEDRDLLAFDTGPGGGLLDDWVRRHTGAPFDRDGALAASGTVRPERLDAVLAHDYFRRLPPKSLDRSDFNDAFLEGLSVADGAATLVALTARTIALGRRFLPLPPRRWLICGGGRHNRALLAALADALRAPVAPVEAVDWDGDALEAQCFAYLAVRALEGGPITYPGTTGVKAPLAGGRLHPVPA